MNILPKKRWHVRTKENIARVRKDEAEAAEKEKQESLRIENANREARISVLKNKSKQKLLEAGVPETKVSEHINLQNTASEHINLFADFDSAIKNTNKEHDIEIKEKKEDYEKKIGYLTYLGQDTNESLKKKNWYEVPPESSRFSRSDAIKETYNKLVLKDEDGKPKHSELDIKNGEIGWKSKQSLDPIQGFKTYSHKTEKMSKDSSKDRDKKNNSNDRNKQRCSKDVKKDKLLKLREARLKRERYEKEKTDMFLTKLNGSTDDTPSSHPKPEANQVKAKYNSQFNPELARQNYR